MGRLLPLRELTLTLPVVERGEVPLGDPEEETEREAFSLTKIVFECDGEHEVEGPPLLPPWRSPPWAAHFDEREAGGGEHGGAAWVQRGLGGGGRGKFAAAKQQNHILLSPRATYVIS